MVGQTDRDWKAVAYAVGNGLQYWEHEGTIDAIVDYDAYSDETTDRSLLRPPLVGKTGVQTIELNR